MAFEGEWKVSSQVLSDRKSGNIIRSDPKSIICMPHRVNWQHLGGELAAQEWTPTHGIRVLDPEPVPLRLLVGSLQIAKQYMFEMS